MNKEASVHAPEITVGEVLRSWRANIVFGESVRLPSGERGVVCGKGPAGVMVVVLDDREAEPRKREVDPGTVFPIWWPEAQFQGNAAKLGSQVLPRKAAP